MSTGNGEIFIDEIPLKLVSYLLHTYLYIYIKQSCTINYVVEPVKAFSSFTYFSISKYIHTFIIRKCFGAKVCPYYTGSAMCICAYTYIHKQA